MDLPELKGSATDHKPIPVGNSSNATLSFSTDGRLWVRKREVHTGFQSLLAEAIAWLICKHIKISVPDAAFHVDPSGDHSWMSQFITGTKHWQPSYGNFIDNLDDVAGMLTLDALLLNEDRRGANILAQANTDGVSFKLWAIDFGNSLVGWIGDFEERGMCPHLVPMSNTCSKSPKNSATIVGRCTRQSPIVRELSALSSSGEALRIFAKRSLVISATPPTKSSTDPILANVRASSSRSKRSVAQARSFTSDQSQRTSSSQNSHS